MILAFIAALPFLGALFPGLTIRAGKNACASVSGGFTALALLLILLQAPAVLRGEVIQTRIDWLPALGLNANFMLDGLGLLFALLILGIGLLIILYARFYLTAADPMGRFYSYLMLFQGAMLGIVLSDNILLLLVFWELTSLSSFLLIGYWKHLPEGRQGARMALAVTGSGGLAMIAGALILGHIVGSYDLSVMLTQKAAIQASPLYLPALILILLGAFTKSAQFPFHFWLPHAMAAPTPVSAYLHSATMVKAGLFLMARLWPVLAGTEAWFLIVATTGLLTMAFAAKVALFKDDLKAILAYSTVSHLGLITFLLGLGTKAGAFAAVLHILCHATFKAALFMTAGIVDHEAHTRDIRRLGGLRHLMPVTFAIAVIATLSMAGVPPLNGFLSKEMMLEAAAHTHWLGNPWLVPLFATLGALLSVGYSLRFLVQGFLGPVRDDYPHKPHDPGIGLWLSPAVLAVIVVAMGLLPMTIAGGLVDAAAAATIGAPVHAKIALWHGLESPALWMSFLAFGGGFVILGTYPRLRALWDAFPRPEAKQMFDASLGALTRLAAWITDGLHNGVLARAFAVAIVTIVALAGYGFVTGSHAPGLRAPTPVEIYPALIWLVLVAAVTATVRLHRQRVLSILMLGIVGLLVSVAFAYLAAPDLALTQITVEVVTVVLLMLALNFLPQWTPRQSSRARHWRDAILSGIAGIAVAVLAYAMMMRDAAFPPISAFHLAQSKPGAGGYNAVNTIIVDFRGYDTYGEIVVLGVAALLIFALAEMLMSPETRWAKRPDQRAGDAGDPHPVMFRVAARLLLPMAMMVGVYLFLRGHNLPGGGFVAGLVFAIGLVMQYIAAGLKWTSARLVVNYHTLIGLGVLVATATGVGSWLAGRPFLTSSYGYFHFPPLEEFELATAMLFDLGVFLCVFGAVMMALDALARLARRAR
ncbi:MAG: monovalent cation/H+ antiporter subunit A [Rhodobacteraceae bacterium]|nr:monovalent cation/H+ antiporter subunit A [Paracoccaceae bacterium]